MTDFAVLGFPKCGTSAAIRLFETLPGINVCRLNGAIEAPFYANDRNLALLGREYRPGLINGHKSSGYIYTKSAVSRLRQDNPRALLVVCVRNPAHSAISWWQMHKKIATRGTPPTHFVNESAETRGFYTKASLDEYYREYAKERLGYSKYIRRLCHHVTENTTREFRLLVLAQEHLAVHSRKVIEAFASLVGVPVPPDMEDKPPHVSAAERFEKFPGSQEVFDALADERYEMSMLLGELARRPGVTLLV